MKAKPFKGKVKIGAHSSLRKLARAMRRGKVPDHRQVIIDMATARGRGRSEVYLNSSPAKRASRVAIERVHS